MHMLAKGWYITTPDKLPPSSSIRCREKHPHHASLARSAIRIATPTARRLPTNYEAAEKNIQLQQATSFRPLDGSRHVRSSRRLFPMAVVQLVAGFLSAEFECEGTSDKGCLRYEGTV